MLDEELDTSSRYRAGAPAFTASKYPPGRGLEKSLWLPFGLVYTPLATPETIEIGSHASLCRVCQSYASIYCKIDGNKWTCSLCKSDNWVESADHLQELACSTMEYRQHLPKELTCKLDSSETLIVVLDANLPADETRGVGRALESLLQNNERTAYMGLVVFNDLVSVYQLEAPGDMAAADIFETPDDMTDYQLASRPYLINVKESNAMETLWRCLSAVYGTSMDKDQENVTANKPLSRLELLKKRKEERELKSKRGSSKETQAAKSPWVLAKETAKKRSAMRRTGEAIQIALDLVPSQSQGRLLIFTNGCPNLGSANVVDAINVNKIDALKVTNVSEFLEELARSATEGDNVAIDAFLMGAGELAMPVFTSLCESSGGYALVHDSFANSQQLEHNLMHVYQQTRLIPSLNGKEISEELQESIPDGCVVDIRSPSFMDTTHVIGPGDLLPETGLLPCEKEVFERSQSAATKVQKKNEAGPNRDFVASTTTRLRLGRYDPLTSFSIMLRANDFHQKDDHAFFQFVVRHVEKEVLVTKVTSRRLGMAKNAGEFLDAIDEEVVAVVLGKEAVYRSMYGREMIASEGLPPAAAGAYLESLAKDSQRDLDTTIQRISGAYRLLRLEQGNRAMDMRQDAGIRATSSSIDFAFPPELTDALLRLYYLRRNPLLSPGPMRAEDDRVQLRSLFLRLPLSDCICQMAPSLWTSGEIDGQLADSTQLEPVRPESLALWENSIIAADYFDSLFVWSGNSVKDKRFDAMRESVQRFLHEHTKGRFPMPDIHILFDGDSMERRFTALLAPSHGDPAEHQLINFPALAELSPESLDRLRSKFSFYDKHVDPSFREWFWAVVGASDSQTGAAMTLCE